MPLRALARVNLAAVERNVRTLRAELRPGAALCAVVKADGYGHGAVPVARAALGAGATWLAVATAQEAAQLRAAGIAERMLVMGAVSADELGVALAARVDLVAWSERFVSDLVAATSSAPGPARNATPGSAPGRARNATPWAAPGPGPVRVHVKLDSGMGRLGTRDVDEALGVARRVLEAPALELAGAMTHFATADDDAEFLALQLARFAPFATQLRQRHPGAIVHAANSAATLREVRSHFDLVRCGIAIYGLDPMNVDPDPYGLEPALELTSYVAAVKRAALGDSVGYGRRFVAQRDTWIATLPIGYADGIRRAFTNDCDVLVGGRRYPLVGTVSMDNIAIDLGGEREDAQDTHPLLGASATIIGADGEQRQTAEQLATRIGTINYEIVCGISARVPRAYHRDGEPA